MTRPVARARVALVTTGGARLKSQLPFDAEAKEGDPTFRVIPTDSDVRYLRFNHAGYDVRRAYSDPDTVFPLQLFRSYVGEGLIGSLAPRSYSLMGYITQYDVLMNETGPAVAAMMEEDGTDLAVLVPV